mgnify:CR=1 FL=1
MLYDFGISTKYYKDRWLTLFKNQVKVTQFYNIC